LKDSTPCAEALSTNTTTTNIFAAATTTSHTGSSLSTSDTKVTCYISLKKLKNLLYLSLFKLPSSSATKCCTTVQTGCAIASSTE
jgi:hypothetical protein